MSTIKAMLFDMDGLLLDTELAHLASYAALCEELGTPREAQDFVDAIGLADDVIIPKIAAETGSTRPVAELIARREELFGPALRTHVPPVLPGVREAFAEAEARGLRRGLVSSSPMVIVSPSMEAFTTEIGHADDWRSLFDAICTGEDAATKPAPDLYLRACGKLGLAPASCLAFEDSPAGVRAALAAGCRVVAVPNPHLGDADPAFARAHFNFPTIAAALVDIEALLA